MSRSVQVRAFKKRPRRGTADRGRTAELHRKQTGNTISLDVNPFAGSLEKQCIAVRSGSSLFDVLVINAAFFVEMCAGGILQPLDSIDPSFNLDPAVPTRSMAAVVERRNETHR